MGKVYHGAMHIKGIGLKRSTDEFQGRLFAALGIAEPDQSVVSDADRVIGFFKQELLSWVVSIRKALIWKTVPLFERRAGCHLNA